MCGRSLQVFLLVSLVFWLFSFPVTAERMYQISETELTALETTIDELEAELKKQVALTKEQQKELSAVRSWLATSEKARIEAKNSLAKANLSFSEYEKEAERTIRGNELAELIEKVLIGVGAGAVGYSAGVFFPP